MSIEVQIAFGSAAFAGAVFFWFWALADCWMFEPPGRKKWLWMALIAVGNVFGAAAYCLWQRPKRFETPPMEE